MYVFGGAKTPTEEITNELWSLDLVTLTWRSHFSASNPSDNVTILEDDSDLVSMTTTGPREGYLPIPVRSHTAHAVGAKMVVLFGLSSGEQLFVNFTQEYDFGEWSEIISFPAQSISHIQLDQYVHAWAYIWQK